MTKYTEESLDNALEVLKPGSTSAGILMAIHFTASHLWGNQIPEDENSAIVRQAYLDLSYKGYFNYNEAL